MKFSSQKMALERIEMIRQMNVNLPQEMASLAREEAAKKRVNKPFYKFYLEGLSIASVS